MAITTKQRKALQTQDFNGLDLMVELFEIQKYTLSKVRELEIKWGARMNSGEKNRAKPGTNSLGTCFNGVRKKALRQSDVDIENIIARHTGEGDAGSQSTFTDYFGGK